MDAFRTRAAHALLALGLLTWVIGSSAGHLHEYLVLHAVCADHGEVVELTAGSDHAVAGATTPSIGEDLPEEAHDHGCGTLLTSWVGLPALPAPPPPMYVKPHHTARVWAHAAPRGPPLAWAPKTSPPQAS